MKETLEVPGLGVLEATGPDHPSLSSRVPPAVPCHLHAGPWRGQLCHAVRPLEPSQVLPKRRELSSLLLFIIDY